MKNLSNSTFKNQIIVKILLLILFSASIFADDCHDYYFSRNFESALQICRDKATDRTIKDNWEAPLILGNMYERGYGVNANFDDAVYWYEKSANAGNCTAMTDLMLMYYNACNYQRYGCNGAKAQYWGDVSTNSCKAVAYNVKSNNARLYSLTSQGRPQDILR